MIGRSWWQASVVERAEVGTSTLQSEPDRSVMRRPLRLSAWLPPSLRLKTMRRPSGENAGLSSMTWQLPGQTEALRSRCWSGWFTGTTQMCLFPPPEVAGSSRVKVNMVPSGDQSGWASPPWG